MRNIPQNYNPVNLLICIGIAVSFFAICSSRVLNRINSSDGARAQTERAAASRQQPKQELKAVGPHELRPAD